VTVVGLGDEGDHGGLGLQQRPHLRVALGCGAGLTGGAEGHELGVAEGDLLAGAAEELGVPGDGARPAALDEAHAELVQVTGDGELVGDGEVDALALGAVAERGVEDVEVLAGGLAAGGRFLGCLGGVRGHGGGLQFIKRKDPSRVREVCARVWDTVATAAGWADSRVTADRRAGHQ
jgi:hypothetical protein